MICHSIHRGRGILISKTEFNLGVLSIACICMEIDISRDKTTTHQLLPIVALPDLGIYHSNESAIRRGESTRGGNNVLNYSLSLAVKIKARAVLSSGAGGEEPASYPADLTCV